MRMSCTGFMIEPAAGNRGQLAPQPRHHRLDAVALAQRLQRHVDRSGVGLRRGPASARSGERRRHPRPPGRSGRSPSSVCSFWLMSSKDMLWSATRVATIRPVSCSGKKLFGMMTISQSVERDRAEHGQQHQEAVVERDRKRSSDRRHARAETASGAAVPARPARRRSAGTTRTSSASSSAKWPSTRRSPSTASSRTRETAARQCRSSAGSGGTRRPATSVIETTVNPTSPAPRSAASVRDIPPSR